MSEFEYVSLLREGGTIALLAYFIVYTTRALSDLKEVLATLSAKIDELCKKVD